MNIIFPRCFLIFAFIALVGCNPADKSPEFEPLRKLVISGQYEKAITQLEAYLAAHPRGKHASRAGLFLFKANFASSQYAEARKWCEWTIQQHPESLEARKCEFKLGLILIAQEDLEGALSQFEMVASSTRNPLRTEAEFFVKDLKSRIASEERELIGEVERE